MISKLDKASLSFVLLAITVKAQVREPKKLKNVLKVFTVQLGLLNQFIAMKMRTFQPAQCKFLTVSLEHISNWTNVCHAWLVMSVTRLLLKNTP